MLALTTNGLQVWSYNPASKAWQQLPSSTPLALGADPWLTDPEYYSTIQTGDVDGDGSDDLIARGPYGIRTWFYDRRGTGGWERYLGTATPSGRPRGSRTPLGAQHAGHEDRQDHPRHRDHGARRLVRGDAAAPTDLTQLQSDLVRIAGCTGQAPANPPSYATCTPPSGSTAFTAADWTAVVNQLLARTTPRARSWASSRSSTSCAPPVHQRGRRAARHRRTTRAVGGVWLQRVVQHGAAVEPDRRHGGLAGRTLCPRAAPPCASPPTSLSAVPSASPTAMGTFQHDLRRTAGRVRPDGHRDGARRSATEPGGALGRRAARSRRRPARERDVDARHDRDAERGQPGLCHLGLPDAHADDLRPLPRLRLSAVGFRRHVHRASGRTGRDPEPRGVARLGVHHHRPAGGREYQGRRSRARRRSGRATSPAYTTRPRPTS